MVKTITYRTILLGLICIGATFGSELRAAHAATFLDPLYNEVTNRLETAGTTVTTAQRRALVNAARALNRNTKTLSADLGLLANVATTLNARFDDDPAFVALEENAVASYSAQADAEIGLLGLLVGTNSLPRLTSRQLAQAIAALERADNTSNSVPVRARAAALAWNKLRVAGAKIRRDYHGPTVEAPDSFAPGTRNDITLYETADVSDQTIYYFHTLNDVNETYYHYTSHHPEELGTWQYVKTGQVTAVLHCMVSFSEPGGRAVGSEHNLSLVFTSESTGTFSGVNTLGETIQGTFILSH